MKGRLLALSLVAVLISGALIGCAGPRHAQYTSTGAGIGAITGGILGGVMGSLSGREAEGVIIGSLLGGLYGAAIGDAEYHQQRSEEAASERYGYEQERARRDLLRIENVYAEPRVVTPGEKLEMTVEYTLLTRWSTGTVVHEVREIRMDGEMIGRPETTVQRTGGTWVSTVPITVPENAESGTYTLTCIVETDEAGDVRETTFEVEFGRGGGSWRR
jgi:hypothetical protein